VLNAIENEKNDIILSVVSVWEMQIKIQLGKLKLNYPMRDLIQKQQNSNNIQILPVSLEHVFALDNLPVFHRDPFDRLLIIQAIQERLLLVSKDKIFQQYPVKLFW
jgi:PIN domain nuclease of toxin-antitoxin system